MKAAILVSLALILLGACVGDPTGLTGSDPPPDTRMEVNDQLRVACFQHTDAQIKSLLVNAEMDRVGGNTRQQEADMMHWFCLQPEWWSPDCGTCNSAIIDQIWGWE